MYKSKNIFKNETILKKQNNLNFITKIIYCWNDRGWDK